MVETKAKLSVDLIKAIPRLRYLCFEEGTSTPEPSVRLVLPRGFRPAHARSTRFYGKCLPKNAMFSSAAIHNANARAAAVFRLRHSSAIPTSFSSAGGSG